MVLLFVHRHYFKLSSSLLLTVWPMELQQHQSGNLLKMQTLRPQPRPESEDDFNKIPRWSVYTLKFEKYYSIPCHLSSFYTIFFSSWKNNTGFLNQEQKYFALWRKKREVQKRESSEEAKNFQLKRFRDSAFNLIFEERVGYVYTGTEDMGCTLHRDQVNETPKAGECRTWRKIASGSGCLEHRVCVESNENMCLKERLGAG